MNLEQARQEARSRWPAHGGWVEQEITNRGMSTEEAHCIVGICRQSDAFVERLEIGRGETFDSGVREGPEVVGSPDAQGCLQEAGRRPRRSPWRTADGGRAAVRVLVACEFSGRVRDAFRALGHDAWSCDLLETESPGPHHRGDVRDVLGYGWDLMVAHPPCTHLAVSGARWFAGRRREQEDALDFVRQLMDAPIPKIAIENPVSVISSRIRKPDQIVQPWQFGHGETKATCLWLKNLPKLEPDEVVDGRRGRVHHEPPGPERWKNRSRTYPGLARAMADQWGNYSLATERTHPVKCAHPGDSGAGRGESRGAGAQTSLREG